MRKKYSEKMRALYELPLPAKRSGSLFNAHAYPTKISAETIALLIGCHTKPGDLVFDGFGGSGTTGLATLLCSNPTTELKTAARRLGVNPVWGPRRAVLYELSGLGAFIATTLCSRPSVALFLEAAHSVLDEASRRIGWMYSAQDAAGNVGIARYFIWSDKLRCPACQSKVSLWESCVKPQPLCISDSFRCPKCRKSFAVNEVSRVSRMTFDDLLGEQISSRSRELVSVNGLSAGQHWSRPPIRADVKLWERIQTLSVPRCFPLSPMMGRGGKVWGDLWRAGYHEGITHVHHFYTRRNLVALATLHELIESQPPSIRDALKLWVSSYNASHSTLMTRVVAKSGHDDLVLTSAQPGVLYVSGLPVEKNVLLGLQRKMTTIAQAFAALQDSGSEIQIVHGSSTRTELPDASVDYVFTDPPFGGNIPYSEVNFIAEAWLGTATKTVEEAIISPSQKKGIPEYQTILAQAFTEVRRILKPGGRTTVAFHSTQADVWRAFTEAYRAAGLSLEYCNILDKKQGSFKQVTTANSAKGDPLILLRRGSHKPSVLLESPQVIRELLSAAKIRSRNDPDEWTSQRLYSRFVEHYLKRHTSPPISATQFYQQLAEVQDAK